MQEHRDDELPDEVAEADDKFGGGYFYRPGQLLVAADEMDSVRRVLGSRASKYRDTDDRVGKTNIVRLEVDGDVPTLVEELRYASEERSAAAPAATVSPNHVLFGGYHMQPFPGGAPRPGRHATTAKAPPAGEPWSGCGVTVAVLDTGVVEAHPWLDGLVAHGATDVEVPETSNDRLRRYAGHGTHIAGVVRCHAPGASVLARRLFGADGAVDDVQLATALAELPSEVGVVNLSLGGVTHGDTPLPATAGVLRDLAVQRPSLVLVASAGNDAMSRPMWPAAFKRVVSVAALGADGERACFSNFGWWVDACAPGVDVESAFFEVDVAPEPPVHRPSCPEPPKSGRHSFKGVAAWSGTSFAAPKVAAAIACAMSLGLDGPEAVFRLIGDSRVPRKPDLGAVVDPPCYV